MRTGRCDRTAVPNVARCRVPRDCQGKGLRSAVCKGVENVEHVWRDYNDFAFCSRPKAESLSEPREPRSKRRCCCRPGASVKFSTAACSATKHHVGYRAWIAHIVPRDKLCAENNVVRKRRVIQPGTGSRLARVVGAIRAGAVVDVDPRERCAAVARRVAVALTNGVADGQCAAAGQRSRSTLGVGVELVVQDGCADGPRRIGDRARRSHMEARHERKDGELLRPLMGRGAGARAGGVCITVGVCGGCSMGQRQDEKDEEGGKRESEAPAPQAALVCRSHGESVWD